MRRTEFLDSTGLGVITGAFKRCRAHDGTAVIVVGYLRVFRVFSVTGLDKVFRLFNDVTAAIEAMSSGDSNRTDPPGPHEWRPLKGWFGLEIYTADFDKSLRLRNSLLAVLKEFAIESVFPFPDDNGYDIRESVLALSAPVSRDDQIRSVCNAIKRYVNTAPTPDSMGDSAIRELVATLKETHDATIELGSALIAYSDSEIVTRIFNLSELSVFFREHKFRDSKGIVSALKSTHAR
jgi:anti-anti-sigma regulatory factor